IILESDQRGRLKLRTEDGQNVPVTVDGSTVQVRNGSTVLVAGILGGGGPNPTPTASPTSSPTASPTSSPTASPTASPTSSPSPIPSPSGSPNGNLFAGLTGPTINGALPMGYAEFEIHSSRLELEVRLRQIHLPAGTTLQVVVDGISVGNMIVESDREARLRLRTDRGETVPPVVIGSTIVINQNGTTRLSGIFAGFASPSPSPSPTGSPGPSPSPSPTFGRSFEAHLLGSGVQPPVQTSATGEIKVNLNAAETQATIFGEFHNLSSSQTGARIESTAGDGVTIHTLPTTGGSGGNFPSVTIDVSPALVQQLRTGLWSAVISSTNHPGGEIRGQLISRSNFADLDGDGGNDFAVFRPSNGVWYSMNSAGIAVSAFGAAGDTVVSGDYDGDGRTDTAVFSNVNGSGVWHIKQSSDGGTKSVQFGFATDIPARGDFDGDGRADIAVYRPSSGEWYIWNSSTDTFTILRWGIAEDIPVPADYDGDGKDDVAVYRPSVGIWYWLRSSDGAFSAARWGVSEDEPVRGDFDGDGKADLAVYRPSEGIWYIYRSSDSGFSMWRFGLSGDIPVAGDYDLDGKTDVAVFRPSDGYWYVLRSSDGSYTALPFGSTGDVPLVAR
ncbi:MAG TPA: FG-GAP-like repeat-containing protein, partial [Pyrinomonadaceae bacterium]|nr:FG-GAP-like repeat-containing protein [Pyrinomonadaceae bacterium]